MATVNHDYTYGATVERDEDGYFAASTRVTNQEPLDSIREAEAIIAESKPGYASVDEMFKAMGVEGVPRDMAAALELARESKATATVKLKLSIEEYLKLEIIAADRRKSVEELLREQVEILTKG